MPNIYIFFYILVNVNNCINMSIIIPTQISPFETWKWYISEVLTCYAHSHILVKLIYFVSGSTQQKIVLISPLITALIDIMYSFWGYLIYYPEDLSKFSIHQTHVYLMWYDVTFELSMSRLAVHNSNRPPEDGSSAASGQSGPQTRPILRVRCGCPSASNGDLCPHSSLASVHLVRHWPRRALHGQGVQHRLAGSTGKWDASVLRRQRPQ